MSEDLRNDWAAWRPSYSPWLIAFSVMLATFMEVLDTSVANVSLPHIAGSLAATPEEATWVLTSYLVSNAIILPATGWLSSFFGRKRFLIVCIIIFTLASALCGMATSLGMIIVARILQGVGGGALQPIAQAVLLESFPQEQRGAAMAVFGLGVVTAPIIGPTLGGWLTFGGSPKWETSTRSSPWCSKIGFQIAQCSSCELTLTSQRRSTSQSQSSSGRRANASRVSASKIYRLIPTNPWARRRSSSAMLGGWRGST